MTDHVPIKRALISVSDKSGLTGFARSLSDAGVTIISTGGTARALKDQGIQVIPIEQVTGFPEMLSGRVKTLHPKVHGGLLGLRDDPEHTAAMSEHGIEPIDLVCVNLYPFEQTVAKPGTSREQGIEQIDIGGPSMIRSAAKNHRSVTVVTDPSQYEQVQEQIKANHGATTLALRAQLASAAFTRTAAYDTAIGRWLTEQDTPTEGGLPERLIVSLPRAAQLRYGENPHQLAALYADPGSCREANIAGARQLHGKQLSFNNINDAAAALELVKELTPTAAAAVLKHANPCGCAVGDTLAEAFDRAYAGDPLAAFGGIVALSQPVDTETAAALAGPGPGGNPKFLEVIIAPDFDDQALKTLQERWKNVRLLAVGTLPDPDSRDTGMLDLKGFVGGVLAQQRDLADTDPAAWQHIAGPKLSQGDTPLTRTMRVAWCAVKYVKSNAILIARDQAVVGVGAGQMDRVQSCHIAVAKANVEPHNRSEGAVAASDAFFPFRDGPDVLIQAGVKVIIQPGGSKRDQDTITACEQAGVTLLFTGRRHFRH